MKKICNFRPIVLFAMSLILGGYFFAVSKFRDWVGFVSIGLILAVSIFVFIMFCKTKKTKIINIAVACFLIPFLIGGVLTEFQINKKLNTVTADGSYLITGTVVQGGYDNDLYNFVLDDVILNTDKQTFDVEGEVYVRSIVRSSKAINVGDKITFYGTYNYTYKDNCSNNPLNIYSYTGMAYISEVVNVQSGQGIKYSILKWSKSQLNSSMDPNEANISYAMLFGDKMLMDSELKTNYKVAGVSHILAVSGLHIGFLIALLGLLLSKIIKNKWLYTSILFGILLTYAYICGWTPSVMRAVVMFGVVILSKFMFAQYDPLNSLAIAAMVNIIISPLNIFNVGFLLSFSVSFSIFALGMPLKVLLQSKMPQKVASSLSISISAWIGSLPIILFYFGTISTYAVLINFLILPAIGVVFGCLVITLLISGLWAGVLVIPELMINGLNLIVEGIANLKSSYIIAQNNFLIMVIGFVAISLISQYNFIRHKRLYACATSVLFIAITVVYSIIKGGYV